YALLVAAMYLAGTLVWHSPDQLVIALVMAVAAAVTGLFGAPANMLAMALIAGPALLIRGVLALVRLRRMGWTNSPPPSTPPRGCASPRCSPPAPPGVGA